MLVLAWGAALLLATQFFADWEEGRRNPNRAPESLHGNGYVEVNLASGRQGHYMAGGKINGEAVTFLLDTGATQVAVPTEVAQRLVCKPAQRSPSARPMAAPQRTALAWLVWNWAISS